jgi:hypothetical protein
MRTGSRCFVPAVEAPIAQETSDDRRLDRQDGTGGIATDHPLIRNTAKDVNRSGRAAAKARAFRSPCLLIAKSRDESGSTVILT